MSKRAADQKSPDLQQTNVPMVYADAVRQVGIGPHVCRFEFALEPFDGEAVHRHRPILSVVMPTPSVLAFAEQLLQQVKSEETRSQFRSAFDSLIESQK